MRHCQAVVSTFGGAYVLGKGQSIEHSQFVDVRWKSATNSVDIEIQRLQGCQRPQLRGELAV